MRNQLVVLILLAIIAAACGNGQTPASTQPAAAITGSPPEAIAEAPSPPKTEAPAVLRAGWKTSPDALNPGTAIRYSPRVLFELVYDTMYKLQLDGRYTLSLAESAERSDDGTVWTFKLRPDMKFHDGVPLTAQDVAFSYRFYQKHKDFPIVPGYTRYFESIAAPDDQTVVITLSEPIPNMESQLIHLYVLPEHIWAQYDDPVGAVEFENQEMVGSGPFKMVEYKQDEFVHLAAVKDHPLQPPKIDAVIFQNFAHDDALAQALVAGQVDMIISLPANAIPRLKDTENVQVVVGTPFAPRVFYMGLNQVSEDHCPPEVGVCSGHPALRDRNVRLALAHATDKQKLIDVFLLGQGTPGLTLIPDGLGIWYNDAIQDYPFDIDQANRILDEAGYLDRDRDGVREMPDGGRPLEFRLYGINQGALLQRGAELLGETWEQIGVRLQPKALDSISLISVQSPAFDYDMVAMSWGSDPDPNYFLSAHLTEEIPTGFNETGYSNPEFDDLFAQQAIELDPEKRRQIIWKMQEILHRDVVYIVFGYIQITQAYRSDRFKGWVTDQPRLALGDRSSITVIEPVE